jgi:hypothetical protein
MCAHSTSARRCANHQPHIHPSPGTVCMRSQTSGSSEQESLTYRSLASGTFSRHTQARQVYKTPQQVSEWALLAAPHALNQKKPVAQHNGGCKQQPPPSRQTSLERVWTPGATCNAQCAPGRSCSLHCTDMSSLRQRVRDCIMHTHTHTHTQLRNNTTQDVGPQALPYLHHKMETYPRAHPHFGYVLEVWQAQAVGMAWLCMRHDTRCKN